MNLNRSIDKYEKLEVIGEGAYGVVFKSRNKQTGEIVALKKLRIENCYDGIPTTTIREISLLKELSHPNIVHLKEVLHGEKNLFLVFEYMDQDLKRFLGKSADRLPESSIKAIMYQVLQGMAYCHASRIVHRDLKLHNLLIDKYGHIKLADFGLARCVTQGYKTYTHEVITLWYRAPEILLGVKRYSQSVDIWSLGCIFAELALSRPLFKGDSEIGQLYKIFQIKGTPNETTWPGVTKLTDFKVTFPKWKGKVLSNIITTLSPLGIELLSKMLCYPPHMRITAEEALEHPYFDDIDRTLVAKYYDMSCCD